MEDGLQWVAIGLLLTLAVLAILSRHAGMGRSPFPSGQPAIEDAVAQRSAAGKTLPEDKAELPEVRVPIAAVTLTYRGAPYLHWR